MADFLLEILSDEIPARMQFDAAEQLVNLFSKKLAEESLTFSELKTYVTPKRLVLHAHNLPEIIHGKQEEIRGPGINAPEKAIEGFCKSMLVNKDQLFTKHDSQYYFVKKETLDRKASAILSHIIEKIMKDFQWAKSMRWGNGEERWVRPVRNILCLLECEVVKFSFGRLSSCGETVISTYPEYVTIPISNFSDYSKILEKENIILDQNIRKAKILDEVIKLAKKHNLEFVHNEKLLNEVTGLVESPKVFIAKIADEFLSLPPEMLMTSMAVHQRFFSFKSSDGSFAPYFAVVTNFAPPDEKVVIEGNKKVLEARLYDAKFFYENDCKTKLESHISELEKVTFHSKLGSVFDKVQRIKKIAEFIAKKLGLPTKNIIRAAELCKADLVTEAVFEFPELQGIMGKSYALNDNEDSIVAEAIEQHYWPISRDDKCPESIEAAIISIADKLDTIVGLFSVNEKPTSSKDPFALRRSTISIIRILIEKKIKLNVNELVNEVLSLYKNSDKTKVMYECVPLIKEILVFLYDRFHFLLKEKSQHDTIEAVLSGRNIDKALDVAGIFDPYVDFQKIMRLEKALDNAEEKKAIIAIKRIKGLINNNVYPKGSVNESLLKEEAEKEIYAITASLITNENRGSYGVIIDSDDNYNLFWNDLKKITDSINNFCDKVLVMVEDEKVRTNRIRLIGKVELFTDTYADFSKIN